MPVDPTEDLANLLISLKKRSHNYEAFTQLITRDYPWVEVDTKLVWYLIRV